jgi:hypothetical protein
MSNQGVRMYTCNRCKIVKEKDKFPPRKANKNKGIDGTCKGCHAVLYAEYYHAKKKKGVNLNTQRTDYKREWYQKNKERLAPNYLYNTRKRQSQIKRATPNWLTKEQENAILDVYKKAKKLEKKDGIKRHVDHVIPLQGKTVCGLHVSWNLEVLTSKENISKGNKLCQDGATAAIKC